MSPPSFCALTFRVPMRPRPCSAAPDARSTTSRIFASPPQSQPHVLARPPAPRPGVACSVATPVDGEGGAALSSGDSDLAWDLRLQRGAHGEPRRAAAAPREDGEGRAGQVPYGHHRPPRRRDRAGLLHEPLRAQPRTMAKRSAPSEESPRAVRLATAGQVSDKPVAPTQGPSL